MSVTIARRILSLVDLTQLGDHDAHSDIVELCRNAQTTFGSVAAVCVWPQFVGTAVEALDGTGIPVAGVANFPEGDVDIDRAVADAGIVIATGGTEVDVVIPWRAIADGQSGLGTELVAATKAAMPAGTVLKVILETGELTDPALIEQVALEAVAGGADFLKTSTGKTATSATPAAAEQLIALVAEHEQRSGQRVGVKVSGGVRTLEQATEYLGMADAAWGEDAVTPATFRFGASSLLDDLLRHASV